MVQCCIRGAIIVAEFTPSGYTPFPWMQKCSRNIQDSRTSNLANDGDSVDDEGDRADVLLPP
jgi:hypothetical protein